ncbi:hypothetical protein FKP32DRAFT_1412516 [Trametes sanguinea]|nr:hypothetical protein FKP32DRAFT_1412516 [Trametes sanguinea]
MNPMGHTDGVRCALSLVPISFTGTAFRMHAQDCAPVLRMHTTCSLSAMADRRWWMEPSRERTMTTIARILFSDPRLYSSCRPSTARTIAQGRRVACDSPLPKVSRAMRTFVQG